MSRPRFASGAELNSKTEKNIFATFVTGSFNRRKTIIMDERFTKSKPTTGEIAVFIPMKKSKAIGIFNSIKLGRWTQEEKDNAIKTILCAPVPKEINKERMSDVIKLLTDRLESQ